MDTKMNELEKFVKTIESIANNSEELSIENQRRIVFEINRFLFCTHNGIGQTTELDGEQFQLFSDYHKYWKENYVDILSLYCDDEQCSKVADVLHSIYVKTEGRAFEEVYETYGLSRNQIFLIRILTANQDFNGSRNFKELADIYLEKPDMTIVMAHANPVSIANNLNHDYVQLVTGGHEHDFKSGIAEKTGILYIQGGWFGQGYASTTIKFKYDNTLTIENSECINIISNDIQSRLYDNDENKQYLDKNILELSHFAWDYIADKMLERLGYIKTSIIRNRKINGNGTATSAGNWVTSLFKEGTNVDVAFYNTDGIRASFEVPDGGKKVITLGNIYSILPFNNLLYIYEVNGKQLKQHLLNGIKYSNYGDQLTGLKFKYTIDSNGNIEITEIILDNGTVVNMDDENTLYRICLSSYSSNLEGSIVNEFGLEPINKQTAKIDAEVVIDMIKKHCGSTDPNEFLIEVDLSERGARV